MNADADRNGGVGVSISKSAEGRAGGKNRGRPGSLPFPPRDFLPALSSVPVFFIPGIVLGIFEERLMFATQPGNASSAYAIDPRGVPTPNVPKEIGVMQRLDGVRSGVCQIESSLREFAALLRGEPMSTSACNPAQSGIVGAISDTEGSIRESLALIRQLTDAF